MNISFGLTDTNFLSIRKCLYQFFQDDFIPLTGSHSFLIIAFVENKHHYLFEIEN